jgi:hypothetical protein
MQSPFKRKIVGANPTGGTICSYRVNGIKIGERYWFEYHCNESPSSAHAQWWYRSHRPVVILRQAETDPGEPLVFTVKFEDGFEGDVFEDELLKSPDEFERPDPPKAVGEAVVEALLDESVAVDLDGTLAKDSGWKGPEHIGEPVKPTLDLVKKLLDDGEDVVIFTARVHDGEKSTKEHIAQWLKDHDLPALEITNEKRPDMEKFYDDKAIAVEKNKGKF